MNWYKIDIRAWDEETIDDYFETWNGLMYYQHDMDNVIGKTLWAGVIGDELWIKAFFDDKLIGWRFETGLSRDFSTGHYNLEVVYENNDDWHRITEDEFWEMEMFIWDNAETWDELIEKLELLYSQWTMVVTDLVWVEYSLVNVGANRSSKAKKFTKNSNSIQGILAHKWYNSLSTYIDEMKKKHANLADAKKALTNDVEEVKAEETKETTEEVKEETTENLSTNEEANETTESAEGGEETTEEKSNDETDAWEQADEETISDDNGWDETRDEVKSEEDVDDSVEKEEEKTDINDKQDNKVKDENALERDESLQSKLEESIKEKLSINEDSNEHIWICDIYPSTVVYNHWLWGENGFDTYNRIDYSATESSVELTSEPVEVESKTEWVDKVENFKKVILETNKQELSTDDEESGKEGETPEVKKDNSLGTQADEGSKEVNSLNETIDVLTNALKETNEALKSATTEINALRETNESLESIVKQAEEITIKNGIFAKEEEVQDKSYVHKKLDNIYAGNR